MPGLKIEPAAPQSQHATLVVAHLRYVNDEPPRADVNAKEQVVGKRKVESGKPVGLP